jgi:AcrR family transcriptional regulator
MIKGVPNISHRRLPGVGTTRDKLLNASERLFGVHGYDGVGMRALAQVAGTNLGAATYHFGSKRRLYIEAVMRRFRPNNAEQVRLLREARSIAQGQPLAVEQIVECMAGPVFALGSSHPEFNALLARNLINPPAFVRAAMHREVEPTAKRFIASLSESLPTQPVALIRMRFMFSMGSLLMASIQIRQMPMARRTGFVEQLSADLVKFISAGLQSAPAGPAVKWPRALRAIERRKP